MIDNPDDARLSIVAVESKPPYPVVVYDLSEEAIKQGNMLWHSLWERLRGCEENDHWPGYVEGISVLDFEPTSTTVIIDGEEVEVGS